MSPIYSTFPIHFLTLKSFSQPPSFSHSLILTNTIIIFLNHNFSLTTNIHNFSRSSPPNSLNLLSSQTIPTFRIPPILRLIITPSASQYSCSTSLLYYPKTFSTAPQPHYRPIPIVPSLFQSFTAKFNRSLCLTLRSYHYHINYSFLLTTPPHSPYFAQVLPFLLHLISCVFNVISIPLDKYLTSPKQTYPLSTLRRTLPQPYLPSTIFSLLSSKFLSNLPPIPSILPKLYYPSIPPPIFLSSFFTISLPL
jgi:hypothetical protein